VLSPESAAAAASLADRLSHETDGADEVVNHFHLQLKLWRQHQQPVFSLLQHSTTHANTSGGLVVRAAQVADAALCDSSRSLATEVSHPSSVLSPLGQSQQQDKPLPRSQSNHGSDISGDTAFDEAVSQPGAMSDLTTPAPPAYDTYPCNFSDSDDPVSSNWGVPYCDSAEMTSAMPSECAPHQHPVEGKRGMASTESQRCNQSETPTDSSAISSPFAPSSARFTPSTTAYGHGSAGSHHINAAARQSIKPVLATHRSSSEFTPSGEDQQSGHHSSTMGLSATVMANGLNQSVISQWSEPASAIHDAEAPMGTLQAHTDWDARREWLRVRREALPASAKYFRRKRVPWATGWVEGVKAIGQTMLLPMISITPCNGVIV